jgi:uncharacterized membrane protein
MRKNMTEKLPTSSSTIAEIKQFLDESKIEYSSDLKKAELLKLVESSEANKATEIVEETKKEAEAETVKPAPQFLSGLNSDLKGFLFKILSGSAQGILIGVLPSAVMKYILQYSGLLNTQGGATYSAILNLFTILIPFLIGMEIAIQFKMKPLDIGVLTIATGAASGSIKWVAAPAGFKNPITGLPAVGNFYVAAGAGDVINAMIVAAIGVIAIWLVAKYLHGFGSVAIILDPIIVGGLVALIGKEIAPYVGNVTTWIGDIVKQATTLQPIPMAMLIAALFAIIIVTPVSTVGIALAISLAGIGSGAAAIGVVASTVILLINSIKVNKKGTSIAIFLGAMKGMMPSVFKKPITLLPMIITGALSGIFIALFKVQGTPTTAGFGWIGFVSPIQSAVKAKDAIGMTNFINPITALLVWFVIPVVIGFVVDYVLTKVVHLYEPSDFKQEL